LKKHIVAAKYALPIKKVSLHVVDISVVAKNFAMIFDVAPITIDFTTKIVVALFDIWQ